MNNSEVKKPYINGKYSQTKLEKKPSLYTAALEENAILRNYLKRKLKLSPADIKNIIEKKQEILLPLAIFRNDLSTLEIIAKYLHEEKKFSLVEIGSLLQRDERTIWHAYQRATKKNISLTIQDSTVNVPLSIFSNRKYAPLEALVSWLKEKYSFSFTNIAQQLQLSPKTVWTVYHRYQKKNHDR